MWEIPATDTQTLNHAIAHCSSIIKHIDIKNHKYMLSSLRRPRLKSYGSWCKLIFAHEDLRRKISAVLLFTRFNGGKMTQRCESVRFAFPLLSGPSTSSKVTAGSYKPPCLPTKHESRDREYGREKIWVAITKEAQGQRSPRRSKVKLGEDLKHKANRFLHPQRCVNKTTTAHNPQTQYLSLPYQITQHND